MDARRPQSAPLRDRHARSLALARGAHTSFDRESLLRAGDALAPFTLVAAAGLPAFAPIAYGIAVPEHAAAGRRVFGVTDEHVTFVNALAADAGWSELGLLRLARALRHEIPAGERFVFRRRLLVGERSDVASITDRAFPMLGFADGASGVAGSVAPAGVRCVIEVQDAASGAPLTQVAAERDAAHAGAPLVHTDWELQEKRLGRSPQSPEAIRAALQRGARLLANLRGKHRLGPLAAEQVEFERLAARADSSTSFDEPTRLELYRQVRTWTRQLALRNPLLTSQPVLFMERRRAVGYMLYEYLGWYYAHGNNSDNGARNPKVPTPKPGGGVYVLEQPGRTLQTRELVSGSAWPGHFVTLALSFDATLINLYFQ